MDFYTLITGATGVLGGAFARKCAENGNNLVLTGSNQMKLEKIENEIKTSFPNVKVLAKTCDLSDEQSRKEFFMFLEKNDVKVNLLVNNAGYIAEGDFLSFSDEEVLKIIRVNCEGTTDFTQKIIKLRDDRMSLSIITISSMAGDYPMPHMSMYSATKAMLTNLMVALSEEMRGTNVFITTICPSGIPTTKAMKDAIKAQGFGGKITACSPEKIVEISLKASKKHKVIVRPKAINKFLCAISRPVSEKSKAKIVGKRWKKSQQKREKNEEKENGK